MRHTWRSDTVSPGNPVIYALLIYSTVAPFGTHTCGRVFFLLCDCVGSRCRCGHGAVYGRLLRSNTCSLSHILFRGDNINSSYLQKRASIACILKDVGYILYTEDIRVNYIPEVVTINVVYFTKHKKECITEIPTSWRRFSMTFKSLCKSCNCSSFFLSLAFSPCIFPPIFL